MILAPEMVHFLVAQDGPRRNGESRKSRSEGCHFIMEKYYQLLIGTKIHVYIEVSGHCTFLRIALVDYCLKEMLSLPAVLGTED